MLRADLNNIRGATASGTRSPGRRRAGTRRTRTSPTGRGSPCNASARIMRFREFAVDQQFQLIVWVPCKLFSTNEIHRISSGGRLVASFIISKILVKLRNNYQENCGD